MAQQGDIIQIVNPDHEWFPCLLCVDMSSAEDLQAVLVFPFQHNKMSYAYIRLKHSDYVIVGSTKLAFP